MSDQTPQVQQNNSKDSYQDQEDSSSTVYVTKTPDHPLGYIETVLKEQNERQAMYIHLLGQGWGKRDAARSAGYSYRARRRPTLFVETPELKRRMQVALSRQGATVDKAARVVSEAMDARIVTTFEGEARQTDIADHRTRVQAAKVTADMMGLTEKGSNGGAGSTVTLTLAGPLADRFAEMLSQRTPQ